VLTYVPPQGGQRREWNDTTPPTAAAFGSDPDSTPWRQAPDGHATAPLRADPLSRGFAAVPPPSPPAGPPTGPLRAVPLGQPGPNAAAGQGSAAVPPPPPPRPGPPTGPLRAVPLGQPGPNAAAGQGSAAVPPPSPPPLRSGPPFGPLRAVSPGQPGPRAAAGRGSAAVPPPPPPLPPQHGPLRADRPHQQTSVPAAVGPSAAGSAPTSAADSKSRGMQGTGSRSRKARAATSRLPGLRLRPRHPLQPCHRRRRPLHCRACRQAQDCSPGLRRRSPASLAGRRR